MSSVAYATRDGDTDIQTLAAVAFSLHMLTRYLIECTLTITFFWGHYCSVARIVSRITFLVHCAIYYAYYVRVHGCWLVGRDYKLSQ